VNTEKLRACLKQIESLIADCLEAMGEQAPAVGARRKPRSQNGVGIASPAKPDLNLPFRPFMHKYARDLSGSEKFTLILAHLVRGDFKSEAKLEAVIKAWGRMKGPLGKFNLAHPTRAKDRGWVDSPRTGVYVLRPSWTEIIRAKE